MTQVFPCNVGIGLKPMPVVVIVFFLLPFLTLLGCSGCGEQTEKGVIESASHSHAAPGEEAHTHVDTALQETESTAVSDESGEEDPRELSVEGLLNAFAPAIVLKDKDPVLANEKVHAIARELGNGDAEWTEYFHLMGHSFIHPVPHGLKAEVLPPADAIRYFELKKQLVGLTDEEQERLDRGRLAHQWNQDTPEVVRRSEPLKEFQAWLKEHAPSEWEVVHNAYVETLKAKSYPMDAPLSEENFRSIEERVDFRYNAFFDALDLLPEGSLAFQELFGSEESPESEESTVQERLLSKAASIRAEPPPPPKPTHPHTIDMAHEATEVPEATGIVPLPDGSPDAEEDAGIVPLPDGSPDAEEQVLSFQERANRAQRLLNQYGMEEGLRRLKLDDPEIAEQIEKGTRTRQISPK